jgi:hypothetical protein
LLMELPTSVWLCSGRFYRPGTGTAQRVSPGEVEARTISTRRWPLRAG